MGKTAPTKLARRMPIRKKRPPRSEDAFWVRRADKERAVFGCVSTWTQSESVEAIVGAAVDVLREVGECEEGAQGSTGPAEADGNDVSDGGSSGTLRLPEGRRSAKRDET